MHSTHRDNNPQHFVDGDQTQLGSESYDSFQLAKEWGLDEEVWDREWATLSGGEAQRVLMAIAVGLRGTEVLLLDGGYLVLYIFQCLTASPYCRTYVGVG
jgi:ABC-type dipeptide/oligopeptide/nickel transport system ATPase subunit